MELSEETMHVLEEISMKKGIPIDECLVILYRASKQTWRDIQETRADTNGSTEKTISGISGNGEEGVRDDIRSNAKKFSRRSWYKC